MNVAYLLTGGNLGKREEILVKAKDLINQHCGTIIDESALYQTEAWGNEDQDPFLNQALKITTEKEAPSLLNCVLKIEQSLGRIRDKKYGPRLIDIDILLFNNEIINIEGLVIPHPQLPYRRFALQCLNDVGGDVVHPVLHKTVKQLLAECVDPLGVTIWG